MSTIVVKIGGSLYDLPHLGARLDGWLSQLPAGRALLVPGGGRTADAVRRFDETQNLGEETSHWLALRALSLNAQILQQIIPGAHIVDADSIFQINDSPARAIVDMYAFAVDDEKRAGRLPHCWEVTSDSLALRLAEVVNADALYLLKSTTLKPENGWQAAADGGLVDAFFPEYLKRLKGSIQIQAINFRDNFYMD